MDPHPGVLWTRGKQAPFFVGSTAVNPRFNFDAAAGRIVVLMFYGSVEPLKNREALLQACTTLRARFDERRAVLFPVSIDPNDPARGVKDLLPGIHVFWDFDLSISKAYGAVSAEQLPVNDGPLSFRSFSLVLDARLRVFECIPMETAQQHTQSLQEALDRLIAEDEPAGSGVNAPVLVVPRVFPRSFCDLLIEIYRRQGGTPSGTMAVKDGKTVGRMDRSFKRRLDCYLEDPDVVQHYRRFLVENLFPQISRAFHFNPTCVERYIVACYEGDDQGFFRAHRDNTTPGTAHRRFACTINLNAEDYGGGDLRFPEYGPAVYRAPTGGAVVFSGSLLHEALPVTSGQRFATLPFIHDDAAEQVRLRNAETITGEVLYADRESEAYARPRDPMNAP